MKGHPIRYSADELAWIEARKELPRRQLHDEFIARFSRDDVPFTALNALCKRNGWLTGRDGRLLPGNVPANKGQKMPFNAASAATRFQPGERRGRANAIYQPIGAERCSKDGYIERKVNDDTPFQRRWRGVHLIRWEEVNGPLPAGHALKCLDGDKTNTNPSNWEAVPRALLPRLNGRFGRDYDAAPADLKPTILAITKLEHAARLKRSA